MATQKETARAAAEAIARWRYDQIAAACQARTRQERARLLRKRSQEPVEWPSGQWRPISLAALYRWVKLWRAEGLRALLPQKRKGTPRARRMDAQVVQVALRVWADDPEMGLTFLIAQLYAHPELRLRERGVRLSRSTLHRHLQEQELYRHLRKLGKTRPARTRYSPQRPHRIWHLDAKGPFDVHLTTGAVFAVHVMTVLDGASRSVLAVIVVSTPDLNAAVRVFRAAARRWGLPDMACCDRAVIFDSHAFRAGLGVLGVHRIWTRSANPEANGKIEAYHRSLSRWFVRRLEKQPVVDLVHLQQLLLATIEVVYQDHVHRELRATPRVVLNGQVSLRLVPDPRLVDAFRQSVTKKTHPKTGEVDLGGKKYLVPPSLRGRRLQFLVDPAEESPVVVVVDPSSDQPIPLEPTLVAPTLDAPAHAHYADGPLQRLYDSWKGQIRPVAEAGFGLPELLHLLSDAAQRHVPMSEDEAALVHRVYQSIGPLGRTPTERAFAEIVREIGSQRPIMAYLDALARRVHDPRRKK